MTRRHRPYALFLAGALLLAGCTGEDPADEAPVATSAADGEVNADDSADAAEPDQDDADVTNPGTEDAPTAALAEETVDTPGEAGGTLTVTLRDLEVRGDVTTVQWALAWESETAADDATANHYELGIGYVPSITDTEGLVLYKPFCTNGSWKEGALSQQQCSLSLTAAPQYGFTGFVNNATVEGWASFPAPEGQPATLDVALAEGLPIFTGVEVAYMDGTP